jgi:isoquinoline 1-oxidoreductase alpha subunit
MAVSFKVNGKAVSVDVSEDMPLLWVLRDVLDMKGTKFGCGIAQCGACTVHVDGTPTRSCQRRVASVAGANVVQRAWEELDVPQCGYCQAGQLMSAAALLASKPNPTDADIDQAMNGNICRCATYLRIRQAIHRAAQMPATVGSGKSNQ